MAAIISLSTPRVGKIGVGNAVNKKTANPLEDWRVRNWKVRQKMCLQFKQPDNACSSEC